MQLRLYNHYKFLALSHAALQINLYCDAFFSLFIFVQEDSLRSADSELICNNNRKYS